VPDAGPFPAQVARTAVSESSAVKFQHILADTFGLEPGTPGPSEGHLPAQDAFGKITVQLGANGHLELSHHYAHGDRRDFVDAGRTFDTTALSSVAGRSRSTAHTTRLIWSTNLRGQSQNEVIVSYQRLLDTCEPNGPFPLIQVNADSGFLIAGSNSVCPTTAVNQYGLEVTENLTISTAGHLLILGLHGELFHFHDPLVQVSAGRWFFANLDSLAKGVAFHYDRGLPGPSPGADFHAVGLGIYAQDRWMPIPPADRYRGAPRRHSVPAGRRLHQRLSAQQAGCKYGKTAERQRAVVAASGAQLRPQWQRQCVPPRRNRTVQRSAAVSLAGQWLPGWGLGECRELQWDGEGVAL